MPGFKITTHTTSGEEDFIEFQSPNTVSTFWNSHMTKDAVLKLIHSADFSKWNDNPDKELSSYEFTKQIITALAEAWYYENPAAEDDSTVKEQLLEMIEAFELDKVALSFDDEDEDE